MEKFPLAVLCDFDGTVTKEDVGFRIYTRFGDERWEEINKRWRRGEISSKECLIGEYSLIDASEPEVREYIMNMEIDPGFLDLVVTCKDNDIPIAIVSDGFDFYIYTILEKYGLSEMRILCNKMRFNGRKVELSFPFYEQGCGKCGNCKKLHVHEFKDAFKTVVYVGDGLSDKFASKSADIIFAKGELMEYLEKHDIEFNKFTNLSDVNNWLIGFLAGDIKPTVQALEKSRGFAPRKGKFTDPCQEDKKPKKKRKKNTIKNLRMKKIVGDMGDGRYIIYYEWS